MLFARWFLVRVPERFQFTYAFWDTLVWHLPFARQASSHRSLARQIPVLQAAVRAGQNLVDAARQTTYVAVNVYARRRFQTWVQAMQDGHDPRESAQRAGFPAPVLRALAAARDPVELAAYLEHLAAYYQALRIRWEQMLAAIIGPLLIFAWGLVVGYFVVALFLPLIALLESVIGSVY